MSQFYHYLKRNLHFILSVLGLSLCGFVCEHGCKTCKIKSIQFSGQIYNILELRNE